MSQTTGLQTGNALFVNTDTSKIFIWNNRYQNDTFTLANATGSDITVPAGTLLGRVTASLKLIPLASAASDGSERPYGILAHDVLVADGTTFDDTVSVCVAGDVVSSKVELDGSDTLATPIGGYQISDLIGSFTVGIKLVDSTENTAYDNQ